MDKNNKEKRNATISEFGENKRISDPSFKISGLFKSQTRLLLFYELFQKN